MYEMLIIFEPSESICVVKIATASLNITMTFSKKNKSRIRIFYK